MNQLWWRRDLYPSIRISHPVPMTFHIFPAGFRFRKPWLSMVKRCEQITIKCSFYPVKEHPFLSFSWDFRQKGSFKMARMARRVGQRRYHDWPGIFGQPQLFQFPFRGWFMLVAPVPPARSDSWIVEFHRIFSMSKWLTDWMTPTHIRLYQIPIHY